jgi:hypothetical protein
MTGTVLLRIGGFVVTFVAMLGALGISLGQEPKDPLFRGRLPAHYGEIVTEAQRKQIYAIQEKYEKQLSSLEDQLEGLKKKRDVEIVAVLSDEQRAKLKRAQEAGAAKRKKASEKKVAEVKNAGK